MPMWSNTYFHNSNSPLMEHLLFFHDHSMILIIFITILSFNPIMKTMKQKSFNHFLLENQQMEMFWTTFPALMLMFIAIPSLKTLYMMEENSNPLLSIKAMGFQWYWAYEYSNLTNKKLNSLIFPSEKIRLEATSNSLIIPSLMSSRLMISSKDVLHSWTIPSLGVKTDAMPGKINQLILMSKRPGLYLGACSEICGAGHSFMPISMESPNMKNFK